MTTATLKARVHCLRYEAREGAFVLTEVTGMSLLGPIRILRRD